MVFLSWVAMLAASMAFCGFLYRRYQSAFAILIGIYSLFLFVLPGLARLTDHVNYLGDPTFDPDTAYQNICITVFYATAAFALWISGYSHSQLPQATARAFGGFSWPALIIAYLMFAALSYGANYSIYGDPFYFLRIGDLDRFSVMVSLVKGGWYLSTLSGIAMVPCTLILGVLWRNWRPLPILGGLALLALTYFITFPPTRTAIIAAIVAFALIRYDAAPTQRSKTIAVLVAIALAVPSIMLLQLLNESRLGDRAAQPAKSEQSQTMLQTLTANFFQYDNGLLLQRRWSREDSTDFSFLLATISPLNLVPSAIVPFEKPRADKDAYLTEMVFGSGLNLVYYSEGSTITFAMPMTALTDFGMLGVIVSGLIFGWTVTFIMACRRFASPAFLFFLSHTLVVFIAALRFSVEGLLQQIQIIGVVLIILKLLSELLRGSAAGKPSALGHGVAVSEGMGRA